MARNDALLTDWLVANDLSMPDSFVPDVRTFYEALLTGNAKMNLTRITDWEAYLTKHVIDSALALLAMPKLLTGRHRIADLGAGAGFPSVILARANHRLKVTARTAPARRCGGCRRPAIVADGTTCRRFMGVRKSWGGLNRILATTTS